MNFKGNQPLKYTSPWKEVATPSRCALQLACLGLGEQGHLALLRTQLLFSQPCDVKELSREGCGSCLLKNNWRLE